MRYPGGRDRLAADLAHARDMGQPPLGAALAALDALDAIRSQVSSKLGAEWAPDTSDFEKGLRRIAHDALPPVAPQKDADAATAAAAATAADPAAPGTEPGATARTTPGTALGTKAGTKAGTAASDGRAWRDAEVTSRDDVRIGLEKFCRYFEQHEPSHPAPLLMRRAQRLLALDFYEIMRDLVPESLPKLDLLSGARSE
ncbi:type VI secretion system protein TssA, partial [Burkholderia sp. Ac-20353]|nr:type VI secretion system protein TssA [Burkholderia sp. Ac-20353]